MTLLLVHWLLSAILSVCSLEITEKDLSAPNELQSYEDPSEVLKSEEDVYLFRAPPSGWSTSNSMCMKSQFLSFDAAKGEYKRTLYYWGFYTTKTEFGPVNLTVLMRIKKQGNTETYIEAVEVGGKENPSFPLEDKPKTTKLPKKKLPSLEPRSQDDTYGMPGECTLWVLQSAVEDPPRRCKFAQLALCTSRAYNAYETEKPYCDVYNSLPQAALHTGR
ncbi:uncharacterized protein LOC142587385 isoform X4 [Dermacentor variabilis]|uniref:uncharacterized protein LOC142587385 isoform X4 n=1 Tax=Dermacentor variabilis TaxID=34621 RepID=UPI003F5BAD56